MDKINYNFHDTSYTRRHFKVSRGGNLSATETTNESSGAAGCAAAFSSIIFN